jgi:hypothetical protein
MTLLRARFLGALLALLAVSSTATAVGSDGPQRGLIVRRPFNPRSPKRLPTSWRIAGASYVNKAEYADLKGGVMEMLKRYPPDKYFFVGLGRDPAPVIAFLQNLGDKQLAVNLPGTSNIQWDGNVPPADVARHIEAAIPERVLQGKRDLVLLDVTSTGKTPAIFGPYLERYLESRGLDKRVLKVAFSWNDVKAPGAKYARRLSDWINTTSWSDFSNYFGGKYEGSWDPENGGPGIGEHQRHEMGPGVEPPTVTNPSYAKFRKALLARMQKDEELDGFLAKGEGMTAKVDPFVDLTALRNAREAELKTPPARLAQRARALVAKLGRMEPRELPRRQVSSYYDGVKLPSLSENGKQLADWLSSALEGRTNAVQRNQVTLFFVGETLETALHNGKIDRGDYQRLLGQALAATTMDDAMLGLIRVRYKESSAMRAELRAGVEVFMRAERYSYGRITKREQSMTNNYKFLMAKLAPRVALE